MRLRKASFISMYEERSRGLTHCVILVNACGRGMIEGEHRELQYSKNVFVPSTSGTRVTRLPQRRVMPTLALQLGNLDMQDLETAFKSIEPFVTHVARTRLIIERKDKSKVHDPTAEFNISIAHCLVQFSRRTQDELFYS